MKLFQSLGIISIILATSFLPKAVLAGLRLKEPLTLSISERQAYGSIGSTRNRLGTTDYIGCSIESNANSNYSIIRCIAVQSNNRVACVSRNPNLLEALRFVNDDSAIKFTWDTQLSCTSITVFNSSYFEPREP